jgi:hypothetical protein
MGFDLARMETMVREYCCAPCADKDCPFCRRGLQRKCPEQSRWDDTVALVEAVWASARREQAEWDAEICDKWVHSPSCHHHDDNPCCHIRMAKTLAAAIRAAAQEEA